MIREDIAEGDIGRAIHDEANVEVAKRSDDEHAGTVQPIVQLGLGHEDEGLCDVGGCGERHPAKRERKQGGCEGSHDSGS